VIQQRLQDIWYGDRPPGLLLGALEKVYGAAAARRRKQAVPHPELIDKPIIVVGNITAGGIGKTPLVMYLVALLQQAGLKTAVISRGYGRSSTGAVRVDASTAPNEGGDEPVLIARRTGVPVYVDANREAAALRAFSEGARVLVADDGLQRFSLPRSMELCVVDGTRGFGNGRLMPAGPLREPLERLETVDEVIVNGDDAVPGLSDDVSHMTLQPTALVRLSDGRRLAIDEALQQAAFRECSAVAGTGNPQRFFDSLQSLGFTLHSCKPFDDHHNYSRDDFDGLKGMLLMTEKDAVKCARLDLSQAWFLEVEASLPKGWGQVFLGKVKRFHSLAKGTSEGAVE
jgi:tetraacyldisaccharide 4'-kinase